MGLIKIIKQKKGDVFQVIFMMIILLIVAIVGLITLKITTEVNDYWDESGLLNETQSGTDAIDTLQDTAPKTTDYAVMFLFLGMNIGIIIAAVRTNFSPMIIFMFIILTLIAIMFAAGSVNIYQGLAQQEDMLSVSSQLTFTNYLFSKYFPLVISMICAMILLVMYGKSGQDIVT
jgi:ammonia channel protein AmtB